jgi:hypothetical protein
VHQFHAVLGDVAPEKKSIQKFFLSIPRLAFFNLNAVLIVDQQFRWQQAQSPTTEIRMAIAKHSVV